MSDRTASARSIKAFNTENKPMLEARQELIGDAEFDPLRLVPIRAGESSMRVRRRMAEQAGKLPTRSLASPRR